MPHGSRISFPILLAALTLPAGALAQSNVVTPAPPPREGTVGPEQLRDFALPGTRTEQPQPATEAPRPATPAPDGQQPAERSPETPARSAVTTPVDDVRPAPREVERRTSPDSAVSLGLAPAAPSPAPAAQQPGFNPTFTQPPAPVTGTAPAEDYAPLPATDTSSPLGWWPWLVAALIALGAAFFFLRRNREQQDGSALAFAGGTPAPAPVQPRPAPAPRAEPRPAPAAAPAPKPVGIISSRLRPWVEIDMAAERVVLTEEEAIIHFELLIRNTGSAPARNVVVEAVALNGGAEQDQELATFFNRPDAGGGGIEVVPPLGTVNLRNVVRMPRAAIREYAAEGRTLFVPIIAFNAGYGWSGGAGRSSTAFLVGRGEDGAEKMAPLRLDLGPREFRPLTQRQLNIGVRR